MTLHYITPMHAIDTLLQDIIMICIYLFHISTSYNMSAYRLVPFFGYYYDVKKYFIQPSIILIPKETVIYISLHLPKKNRKRTYF